MKTIEIIPKIKVDSKEKLALVYTPGVAKSSNAIKEDYDKVLTLQTGQIRLQYYLLVIQKA